MATTLLSPATKGTARASTKTGMAVSAGLTAIALVVHGYHPYAEDGGVYLAGVKRMLDPALYPRWSEFVTAHLHFSLFAPLVAALARISHLGLMTVMLALYALTTGLTLYAGWMVVERCTQSRLACCGAVTLLALTLTIPVAGTSLMLMDPYVTARNFSTPLGLVALAGALDVRAAMRQGKPPSAKTISLCCAGILLGGVMHPLMAAYALECVLLLVSVSVPDRKPRIGATAALCGCGLAVAACCAWFSPVDGAVYTQIAHTRAYWFVGTWRWYEQFGLIAPLLVLAGAARCKRKETRGAAWQALAAMAAAAGGTAIAVAVLFSRWNAASFTVAKLQPLRVYQTIYAIMILALGASLAERALKRSAARWTVAILLIGGGMAWVQAKTFPHSTHFELPWNAPENGWEQAFQWVRGHTPRSAVFALDAEYIGAADEDAHNFRAIAERSALPDNSKDGGVASIAPALSREWLEGEQVQTGLDQGVGPTELTRLRAQGVTWFIVLANTPTAAPCDYANGEVKVCRVPR